MKGYGSEKRKRREPEEHGTKKMRNWMKKFGDWLYKEYNCQYHLRG